MSSSLTAAHDYGVVHVRARARYARMLTQERWANLRKAQDLDALLNMLAETVYGPYLELDRAALTPRRAAYQIRKHLADTYEVIIGACPESRQRLLVHLRRLFEVDNLKAILRGVAAGATWEQVRYTLAPLNSSGVLPSEEMLRAGSIESAVELLSDTPYFATLSHALERYAAEQSLFPLEVALDLDYLRELWDDINRLAGRDRSQAMRILGTSIDATNLLWAMRYRVYYHLSEEEIINYTLPLGYQARDSDIRMIASGGDMAEVIARVFPRLPDTQALLQEPRKGLQELEIQLYRHIADRCRAAFVGYPFHLGIPLAYLLLSEYEVQDLTVLIEAKAVQMPLEYFEAHLVLGYAPA